MRLRVAIAAVVAPLVLWGLLPVLSEGASPNNRLDQVQRRIAATKGKIGRRKGTERVLTTQISAYTARINRLQASIGGLQRRQAVAESDLQAKRAELFKIQDDLRTQRRRLVRLKARLAQARAALAQRLTELYTADAPDVVTVILSSKGFSQLLERGEFMQRISEQDQQVIKLVRSAKADATNLAQKLAKLEARQQQVTQIVQQRRDEIAQVKQGLINTRVGLASTRAGKRNALSHVRTERVQLEGNLSDLKAQQAKIQATLQQAGSSLPAGAIKQGNGSMIWPVNGPITSQFCERRAWAACHPGIDIGVPSGTPIRAAAAGKVALVQSAAASGGYGNYTCIQHTSSLSTCYAHQSAFKVSVGQTVSQGQVIGISGCTGLCFGPHLHFEVRINGSVTNPMNYL
ncbi:MAG: murein hydrolase activator EnvC family protein [Solirubrobacteraceae bacterium]